MLTVLEATRKFFLYIIGPHFVLHTIKNTLNVQILVFIKPAPLHSLLLNTGLESKISHPWKSLKSNQAVTYQVILLVRREVILNCSLGFYWNVVSTLRHMIRTCDKNIRQKKMPFPMIRYSYFLDGMRLRSFTGAYATAGIKVREVFQAWKA